MLSRTWFTPRPFPLSSSPLSHLSTKFVSQLVLLRTIPSAQSPTERLLVIFSFSSAGTNSSLIRSRSEDGTLLVRCENDSLEDETKAGVVFVSGSSEGFDYLIKTAVEIAQPCLHPSTASSASSGTPDLPRRELKDLTLCTWNALGQDFTLSQLLEWLDKMLSPSNTTEELIESFKRGGLMLDDGWQETGIFEGSCWGDPLKGLKGYGVREGWYDLEREGVNKEEKGWELKDAVRRIREKGIEKIGVWITITGYVLVRFLPRAYEDAHLARCLCVGTGTACTPTSLPSSKRRSRRSRLLNTTTTNTLLDSRRSLPFEIFSAPTSLGSNLPESHSSR